MRKGARMRPQTASPVARKERAAEHGVHTPAPGACAYQAFTRPGFTGVATGSPAGGEGPAPVRSPLQRGSAGEGGASSRSAPTAPEGRAPRAAAAQSAGSETHRPPGGHARPTPSEALPSGEHVRPPAAHPLAHLQGHGRGTRWLLHSRRSHPRVAGSALLKGQRGPPAGSHGPPAPEGGAGR